MPINGVAFGVKKACIVSLALIWFSLPSYQTLSAMQESKKTDGAAPPPSGQPIDGQSQGKSEPPEAKPDANGIYASGNGVTPPKVIEWPPGPSYTDKASQKKISGTCVVELVVDIHGNPHDAQIVKSITEGLPQKQKKAAAGLDQNALENAMKYRFQPGEYKGKPVPVHVKIEVTFQIY